jgi:basic amino acid/polyamine antiporter, APA family
MSLQRKLGLSTVLAVVMGDMIGSGIFFTPGELAAVASAEWQVYFFWAVCGLITLCGALTLAELAALLPRAGVAYHALTEAYGPFAGFMQAWIMVLVSGPGAIAGVAILFGTFAADALGMQDSAGLYLAAGGIGVFAVINLLGVNWGGSAQVVVTVVKVLGLVALTAGARFLAEPVATVAASATGAAADTSLIGFLRFIGVGVSIVLFTYDGWIDASHVAGEVRNPNRNFPLAMGLGVVCITLIYLLVNVAWLSVVPLAEMRADPAAVASRVATAAFGDNGAVLLVYLIGISIFGALGGLILTLPRLYYSAAAEYQPLARGTVAAPFFDALAYLSGRTAVPAGAILMACGISIVALFFFGSFNRIVTFFVVPFQFINILMVGSIFRLRPRLSTKGQWRLPLYPWPPLLFMFVMALFLLAAFVFNPFDSLIGIALTLAGMPVYRMLAARRALQEGSA